MDDAQKFGMRKGLIGSIGMGVVFFVIFAVYALAFWYGCKLVRDEPDNYSVGNLLIVSENIAKLKHYFLFTLQCNILRVNSYCI